MGGNSAGDNGAKFALRSSNASLICRAVVAAVKKPLHHRQRRGNFVFGSYGAGLADFVDFRRGNRRNGRRRRTIVGVVFGVEQIAIEAVGFDFPHVNTDGDGKDSPAISHELSVANAPNAAGPSRLFSK